MDHCYLNAIQRDRDGLCLSQKSVFTLYNCDSFTEKNSINNRAQ